jgi:hypothetical protein
MDQTFTPWMGFADAVALSRLDCAPIAIVLPTVKDPHSCLIGEHSCWIRIGQEGRPGMHKPTSVFSWLQGPDAPRLLISHADQLCSPLVATIQLLLRDRSEFISPTEIILNTKYGFRLLIWTRSSLISLPPASPPKAIAASLVSHLGDCETLGHEWLERQRQGERTLSHRVGIARNQLRFLRSCIANAFSCDPDSPEMTPLLRQIEGVERFFEGTMAQ